MHIRTMQIFRTFVGVFCLISALAAPITYAQWGGYSRSSEYSEKISALGSTVVASLPIPILLGVDVNDLDENFGDPRSGGRTHAGLDMMSPNGTPIASPTAAVVTGIGNGANSGLYVRTAIPGGESLTYMHLSQVATGIERGMSLARGDILGFVGNTGNASGGAAHLHLEIRKSGVATDPYPRLKEVFTLAEQIAGTTQALSKTTNTNLAAELAHNFKTIYADASSKGFSVPPEIAVLLSGAVNTAAMSIAPPEPIVALGSENSTVKKVQEFLIQNSAGPKAVQLAAVGPTGYFGTLTQAALTEYQAAEHLWQVGYLNQQTYQYMFEAVIEGEGEDTTVGTIPVFSFSRNLEIGDEGSDVRLLQEFLNANGVRVATSGVGSPGQESTYFGRLTEVALITFQRAHAITPAAGYFGPITRARVNGMIAQ